MTYASSLTPSLSILFLDRSKTFNWHFAYNLLESRAKTSISAIFLCNPVDYKCSVYNLGLLANNFTY